jgi:DnaJ homolog subfamily C member 2
VLGLSKLRWRATDEDIKKAHRKKVLRHHPDKKAAAGEADTDSFFKMIQKAHEILTDPVRRRQFDSVDEEADIAPPEKSDIKKPSHFYKKWGAFFESEGRFSTQQPVPKFGDDNTTREELDEFYNFWTNFKDYSWRSFEYLDEDVPDDNADRDHKRHIEKKNRNARTKRKNADIARLSQLVEKAMASDERIKKFRQAKNAEKNKKRNEKEAAAKREAEERQKAKEEEERKKKEAEEQAKVAKEAAKKDKDAAKNAAKKNRRVLRDSAKNANYFVTGDPLASAVDAALDDVEKISKAIDVDELADLVAKLNVAGKDSNKVKAVYVEKKSDLVSQGKVKDGDFKVFK